MPAEIPTTEEKQCEGLAATLSNSLTDLAGQQVTPELVETIKRRLLARMAIVDQLVEHESDG